MPCCCFLLFGGKKKMGGLGLITPGQIILFCIDAVPCVSS